MQIEELEDLLKLYKQVTDVDVQEYVSHKTALRLPIIPTDKIKLLAQEVGEIFAKEPTIIDVSAPLYVVGDLHGHFLDLCRILKENGFPPDTTYLFLGDIVDRGEMSIETVTFVLLLKRLFPTNVYIIRGNHEFREISKANSFYTEIQLAYDNESVFDAFINCFEYMPLVARVEELLLCVHGGVGQNYKRYDEVQLLQRPIKNFENLALTDLLWSDPEEGTPEFKSSPRGLGCLFGEKQAKDFLSDARKNFLCRGHQSAQHGVETQFNGCVITVFSASNYCGTMGNEGGVLYIPDQFHYEPIRYPPLGYLKRYEVIFSPLDTCLSLLRKSENKASSRVAARRRLSTSNEADADGATTSRSLRANKLTKAYRSTVDMPRLPFNLGSPNFK
ncbi:Ser/Thr protein phosphatase, putative [Trichomonas vaginalis G3]|uniref:Serine/threonine-protein phosphatase n=1 Tax=Trichomonas vaginalis (strain ATCC PRA-98 / G3) TaxID=412133 RepID=A2E5T3_TRIV3|nr:phosphoprotein phosphatase protein [Trichomonas vaginalis G3]EAY12003.1 Ser/Thr protein phosphatase, putative [Trichomonas vaginalis G3]KAI5524822.1 phosphoprotein phosphatase protein [Trichomonas vaginalis G3]|eukprot:XP_001324226.1 Ser/Thr protein phosphatase [Trichomonas vaginalis G3]